ncbi:MAG TPA: C1 family peptidase [Flavitalea sp.]|nr:C1 family peptidase [Flavitalea sp.]
MAKQKKPTRMLDARPDTLDFRDKMYQTSLYEVPTHIELEDYQHWKVPVLDQGTEGACTGYGLATVANYLLRRRKIVPDPRPVSPKMLYQMAKRYDEWPGEAYSGSSARGAMKGWHKHGVCGEECWPQKTRKNDARLNETRSADALHRPLGAYYRVNHKDIIAMHSAIAEVGVLYATSSVHTGWDNVKKDGIIPFEDTVTGGHAFAIVGYNQSGFWIQNSWGNDWGRQGFALVSYDDWLENGDDVWVARLGAPITLTRTESTAIAHSAAAKKSAAYSYSDLRPHVISIGNNGQLNEGGNFGTSAAEVKALFEEEIPRITQNWKKRRILLYAHGGLVSETAAVQRLAEYRTTLLSAEVYPISFIWHSDAWTTLSNVLKDAFASKRPEGFLDGTKDFMLDRLDDALEPVARAMTGKLQWSEMKENAMLSTCSKDGGARFALDCLKALADEYPNELEIHVAGHSAGSIFNAHLVQLLTTKGKISTGSLKGIPGLGLRIATCTLWAPACTMDLFKETYLPSINNKTIGRFALFILNNKAELDDNCGKIYNKSLLFLVSNAFEKRFRIPIFRPDGEAILGMQKFVEKDTTLSKLFTTGKADLILSPNNQPVNSVNHSTANTHGSFDDDIPTATSLLRRILGGETGKAGVEKAVIEAEDFKFRSSASSLKDRREELSIMVPGTGGR